MYKAIAANKRNTLFIMTFFVVIIGVIGYLAGLYFGDISFTWVIIFVALLYAVIQYFLASKLAMELSGAKEIRKSDNPRLFRIVENLAITLGIATPKVYIINDPAPNAFATGRDPEHAIVGATSGLLDIMSDRELEAVIAHEMGHVKNYDIRVSMISFGLVAAIGLLSDFALRMLFFGDNRSRNNNPAVLVIGLIAVILAPIAASLIQLAISRQREFLADASGAMITRDSEGLASALEKLKSYGRPLQKQQTTTANMFFSNPLSPGFMSKLFSSHPPLDDRIKRLRENAAKF